jgi:hypothetical protein
MIVKLLVLAISALGGIVLSIPIIRVQEGSRKSW